MESIIEALVQAGYFRARISTLTDFDKIIGGMAWAMQVFSCDIDINIFYTDTLDLGEKIALTERLVMVLLVMNCPHQIEPHQIVGLDYANLLPVICWLIRKSAEVRQEQEAFNRLLALRHFFRVIDGSANLDEWFRRIPSGNFVTIKNLRELPELASLSRENNSSQVGSASRTEQKFESNKQVSLLELPALLRAALLGEGNVTTELEHEDEGGSSGDDSAKTVMHQTENVKTADIGDADQQNLHHETGESDLNDEDLKITLRELDNELLATNQKILNLLKKLDSTPHELEISQYQKRYIELHQQLISKNKHLKKLFALFNSLDSTKHYLTKEINLLDSIFDNLDLTNDSAENRSQFLKQFQDIIVKIQNVKDDVLARLEINKQRCDSLITEYAELSN